MIGSAHDYVVSAQKQDTVPMVVYGDCWLLRIEEGAFAELLPTAGGCGISLYRLQASVHGA